MQNKKRRSAAIILKILNKKRGKNVNHEVLKQYIGVKCGIHTLGQYANGKVLSLNGNWMEVEVETKKDRKIELVNVDLIEKITVEG